jgi:hypothetical protein
MKSAMLICAVVVLALLPACAQQPQKSPMGSSVSRNDRIDYEKMAAVEREASRLGVEVRWIHPPHKRDLAQR